MGRNENQCDRISYNTETAWVISTVSGDRGQQTCLERIENPWGNQRFCPGQKTRTWSSQNLHNHWENKQIQQNPLLAPGCKKGDKATSWLRISAKTLQNKAIFKPHHPPFQRLGLGKKHVHGYRESSKNVGKRRKSSKMLKDGRGQKSYMATSLKQIFGNRWAIRFP